MQLDPRLRERILRVLHMVVPVTEEYCCGGEEHREACSLMNELTQGVLFFNSNKETIPVAYSEKQCMDAGVSIGMKPEQCSHFFHHYNSQGWVKGNGLPIIDLTSQMWLWKKNGFKDNTETIEDQFKRLKEEGKV